MLSVENLAYHYKGRPAVLKDVNFNVNTGEFLAILGNNGVGKSTMLKCFNKILTPDGGKIILDDENLLQMNARQVAQRVAFVAQNVPSTQMTVHDMVMLGRRPYMNGDLRKTIIRLFIMQWPSFGLNRCADAFSMNYPEGNGKR